MDGELVAQDGYHYYPPLDLVRAWLIDAGCLIDDEVVGSSATADTSGQTRLPSGRPASSSADPASDVHETRPMDARFGYALSSEEHSSPDLVRHAARAEEAGFEFALISDHFHPWVDAQGYSPFVWSVLGAIANVTERLEVGTGVTCPIIRIHPAIIAQAAATTADLFGDRFFLGVGTGENLNEHILGDPWPEYEVRSEMLIESLEIMRALWRGQNFSHRGDHYVVQNARLYTLPKQPIRVMVAAAGPLTAQMAATQSEGMIVTSPERDVVDAFRGAGGADKPIYGQATVCWAASADEAKRTMHRIWPNAGLPGDLSQELPLPLHFEQASSLVTPEKLAESMPHGPDVAAYVASIRDYLDAGIDHVYLHQVGPDQDGFFRFWQDELQVALSK